MKEYYNVIITVLVIFIIIKLLIKCKKKSSNSGNMKWAILLTSCVRTRTNNNNINHNNNQNNNLMKYYSNAIKSWLEKTNLPIFIVESSGYTFPEFANTRLKVCSFDLTNQPSSSQYEAKSILYAMNYFKNELKPYTHIMKVTGRYYLDIENILPTLGNVDMILQSKHSHFQKWNNSEIFGYRNGIENEFLDTILNQGYMEEAIYKYAHSHTYERLPPIPNINKIPRGGDNLIIDPL